MTRADQVAAIMETECDEHLTGLHPGRPYFGQRHTAERIGDRIGANASYVRQIQANIRARLGPQAC